MPHDQFTVKLIEQSSTTLNKEANKYYDLFITWEKWHGEVIKQSFDYRQYEEETSTKKLSWLFFLTVITPLVCVLDYASISSFLEYIASSAPSFLQIIVSIISWLFFAALEIGCGLLIINAKDKPWVRGAGVLLAAILICIPSVIVYATYVMTPDKSDELFMKVVTVIIISLVIHCIFFLTIKQIISGLFLVIYRIKRRVLLAQNPQIQMQVVKKTMQEQYAILSRYAIGADAAQYVHLLTNLAWYIVRTKIISPRDAYNLSDFDANKNYAPIPQSPSSSKNI